MPKNSNQTTIPPETVTNPDDALFANPRFMVYLLKQIDAKMDEQKLTYNTSQAEVKIQIEEQFKEVNKKLEDIPGRYATKDEVKAIREDLDGDIGVARVALTKEIDSLKSIFSRLNWIVITAVLLAVLGIVMVERGGL